MIKGLSGTTSNSVRTFFFQTMEEVTNFFLNNHATDARSIHGYFFKISTLVSSLFICNNLIRRYVAQLMLGDARSLFDEMPQKNDHSWSAMISGYTRVGSLRNAVSLFKNLSVPNKYAFGTILKGCTSARDLGTGMQFHCGATKYGIVTDAFIASTLVDMYGKCGDVNQCWRVFEHSPDKDVVAWTTMIALLANQERQDLRDAAFGLFGDMITDGVWAVDMTFNSLVKIFDEPRKLGRAKQVHGCIVKFGIQVDDLLGSALIAMYGSCQGLDEAIRLSSRLQRMDMVSWTCLLNAYIKNGAYSEAMDVFYDMVNQKKLRIDPFAVTCILGACSSLEIGKEIHGYALRKEMIDVSVSNAMITLYGRYHQMRKAEFVFQLMRKRDDISWTALSTCYLQNHREQEALSLFVDMVREGWNPSTFSITGAIRGCSSIGSLFLGEEMHSRVVKMGIDPELSVKNSLTTMYGKCGDIIAALRMFLSVSKTTERRDVISWNAMIAAFSQHGFEKEALTLFYDMQKEGTEPDDYTFLGVLVSCSRAGRVDEAVQYFNSMESVYGIEPKMEHYACMVDLYGRSGKPSDAMEFINTKIPCSPNHLVWETLLASCMFHGDVELGRISAERILEITPDNSAAYTVISNLHASKGMWGVKADVLARMKSRGIRKEASKSWVEFKGRTHVFFTNGTSHPMMDSIRDKLEEVKIEMEEAGYVPDTNCVLQDIEDEQKERALLHHSEKLALAFALLVTAVDGRTPIRIMQNLRCCGDCHAAFQIISSIEDRHIILRDRNRFHHFRRGACSCKDYR